MAPDARRDLEKMRRRKREEAAAEARSIIEAIPRAELERICATAPDEDAPEEECDEWLERALTPWGFAPTLVERVVGAPAGTISEAEAERRLEQAIGPAIDKALKGT